MHPAARAESACNAHPPRPDSTNQIVQYAVDRVLVLYALVAKALEIELEALELHAKTVRNVFYLYLPEVRLTGLGAEAGELRG